MGDEVTEALTLSQEDLADIEADHAARTAEGSVSTDDTGQASASPTDTATEETGSAEGASASAASDKGQEDGGKKVITDETGQEFIEIDGKKYYASFDKHPEWQDLSGAKKVLQGIMDEQGFDTPEEAMEAVRAGQSVRELLGDQDLNTLLQKSETLDEMEAQWALEEARKKEENETPDQTIERLKKEKQELVDTTRMDSEQKAAIAENQKILKDFNTELSKVADGDDDLTEDVKPITRMLLGLDNPVNDIEMTDKAATKKTAAQVISSFKDFLKEYKQKVIDEYAAGKSKVIPVKKGGGDEVVASKPKELPPNASVEDEFAAASAELTELLEKQVAEGQ